MKRIPAINGSSNWEKADISGLENTTINMLSCFIIVDVDNKFIQIHYLIHHHMTYRLKKNCLNRSRTKFPFLLSIVIE